jgi:hypothetical protein
VIAVLKDIDIWPRLAKNLLTVFSVDILWCDHRGRNRSLSSARDFDLGSLFFYRPSLVTTALRNTHTMYVAE